MGPTWGPPGSSRPQMGPMLVPWALLLGDICQFIHYVALKCPTKIGNSPVNVPSLTQNRQNVVYKGHNSVFMISHNFVLCPMPAYFLDANTDNELAYRAELHVIYVAAHAWVFTVDSKRWQSWTETRTRQMYRFLYSHPIWWIDVLTHPPPPPPPWQNIRRFADDLYMCIFVNVNFVFW